MSAAHGTDITRRAISGVRRGARSRPDDMRDGEVGGKMWMIKSFLIGLFMLASCSSLPAWSQPSQSPKQTAIAWTFELELLLMDISSQIINSQKSDENEKRQIEEQMKRDEEQRIRDEQHSKESSEISTEESKVIEQSVMNQDELDKLFSQSAASLKASRTECDTWRGIAIAVTVIGGIALGMKCAGWW